MTKSIDCSICKGARRRAENMQKNEMHTKRKRQNSQGDDGPSKAIRREVGENDDDYPPSSLRARQSTTTPDSKPPIKADHDTSRIPPSKTLDDLLRSKKLKSYYINGTTTPSSPFPTFPRPTHADCTLARRILTAQHGPADRPSAPITAGPTNRAGCGDAPTVLDALVRTILSQHTSDANAARAKRAMDAAYGSHANWAAIVAGGAPKLAETIRAGGLSNSKSRTIVSLLSACRERYGGDFTLEHLRALPNEDAMRELLGFRGVGPKTASCVLLFCLGRASFAVDTHVHRIAGLLGWRPVTKACGREETHLHLDARVPDGDKYALHRLFVKHGKICPECRAGGKARGRCELRKAFAGKMEKADDE